MAKFTTRAKRATTKVSLKTSKKPTIRNIDLDEDAQDDVEQLEEIVTSKPDASAKPSLSIIWPVLLVISILSCIGIPFLPFAERILLSSLAGSFFILSIIMILKYEKDLKQWYIDNPEFVLEKHRKRTKPKRAGRANIKLK